jgi:hypothetical protein
MDKAIEINCETGEVTERPLTAAELQAQTEAQAQVKINEQAKADKATAKAALLVKLGITEEEADLLA